MARLPRCEACNKVIRRAIIIVIHADSKRTGNAFSIVYHWKTKKKEYYHRRCVWVRT